MDVVEIVYEPDYFSGNNSNEERIDVLCNDSPARKVFASKEVVQFNLPEVCEAKSKMFQVEKVKTAYSPMRTIQDKEIQIKFFSLSESRNSTNSVESESTYEVINSIAKEVEVAKKIKEAGEKERRVLTEELGELKTKAQYGSWIFMGVIGIFALLLIIIGICCFCKCK